jgi:hypothetical protein
VIFGFVALATLPGFASMADVETQPTLSPTGFEIGQAFPPLAFPSLESDRPTSLAGFRGEKVVLQIFASW